MKFDSY